MPDTSVRISRPNVKRLLQIKLDLDLRRVDDVISMLLDDCKINIKK